MSDACAEVVVTLVARDRRQVVSDLVALTKPRVVVVWVSRAPGIPLSLRAPPAQGALSAGRVGGRGAGRAPAGGGRGACGGRRRAGRWGALRRPFPRAPPAHAVDRPPLPRRLRP